MGGGMNGDVIVGFCSTYASELLYNYKFSPHNKLLTNPRNSFPHFSIFAADSIVNILKFFTKRFIIDGKYF